MGFGESDNNEFFNSWALWQKMTFVLGCGIAITIVLGFLKLWYNHNKIRKYTKVDKGKQAQTPEMLEAQPVTAVSTQTKDEVPFGIRAIQSGIEIDGVWISRSNTPVASSRASIISDRKDPGSYTNSQLELPQAAKLGSSRNSSRAPSSAFDRAVSAERIPHHSRSSSSGGRGQTSPEPVRCGNCNHHIAYNATAPQNVEFSRSAATSGPPSLRHELPAASGRTSNKSSRRTSGESDYMAITQDVRAYETAYHSVNVDPRTDLASLQSHRMSHVAETGQLTPRVRKPGHSGEWASVAEHQTQTVNGVSYFIPRKTPSPPLAPIADHSLDAAPVFAANSTQDSHASNEAKQGVPLMESYAPKAAYYPDTYEPRGPHHQYSYDEVPYEVNTDQNQHRESQVLRNVNSGFQVLKPGTFAPLSPEDIEANERRQSKKLQKKRRSSETRQSAFVESV